LSEFVLGTLVFARVGALVVTAPLFGVQAAPVHIRAFLAIAMTLLVVPLQGNAAVAFPDSLASYGVLLACETIIGAALGLGVMLLIAGMGLAGELIGYAGGLSISDVFDPASGEDTPHFSRLLILVAVGIFLAMGGHRMVMAGLLDTFRALPVGSSVSAKSLVDAFTALVTQSFSLGVRTAAPTVTSLLLATIALGLIGRTLPQINILAVGFGLNAMLTFAVLGLTLGAVAWAFQDRVAPALQTILNALGTSARPEWLS
jgi:flagellar biosynthetic protein FliR